MVVSQVRRAKKVSRRHRHQALFCNGARAPTKHVATAVMTCTITVHKKKKITLTPTTRNENGGGGKEGGSIQEQQEGMSFCMVMAHLVFLAVRCIVFPFLPHSSSASYSLPIPMILHRDKKKTIDHRARRTEVLWSFKWRVLNGTQLSIFWYADSP